MSTRMRTHRFEDVEREVGRARGEVRVVNLREILKTWEKESGKPIITSTIIEDEGVEEIKREAEKNKWLKLKYERQLEAERAKEELNKLKGSSGGKCTSIYCIKPNPNNPGEVNIEEKKVKEGEAAIINVSAPAPPKKEEPATGEAAKIVEATAEAFKKGVEVSKGKAEVTTEEVRRIAKEVFADKIEARLSRLESKIDDIISGKGNRETEVTVIRELKNLGLLKVPTGKESGASLVDTLKELQQLGVIQFTSKSSTEAKRLEFEKEKE